ncbi:hypothetical protein GOV09_00650 [Candidatus Woesearchaeota archaeon]|nr:hypothetical protein [Candidatus Woesearchaeota archaeon]
MKDLELSEGELKILSEPPREDDWHFFTDRLTAQEYEQTRPVWDKILGASEVDDGVIARVSSLLPNGPISIEEEPMLTGYNCFVAVAYALGIEVPIIEKSVGEAGIMTIPMGIASFSRPGFGRSGFSEVESFEEPGCQGAILLESSKRPAYNHSGVYVGSNGGTDFFFHKNWKSLPTISSLDALLVASSHIFHREEPIVAKSDPAYFQKHA